MQSVHAQDLTWSIGGSYERAVSDETANWLRANPPTRNDDNLTMIHRVVYERISKHFQNPVRFAYPTSVSYDTIWATLLRTESLDAQSDRARALQDDLDAKWAELVALFGTEKFTKQPHTDD